MTTHLISILGLPRKQGRADKGEYQTASYAFSDGAERTSTNFGMALGAWLQTRSKEPLSFDRILWLGTAQSAWGSLLQAAIGDEAILEPVYDTLYQAETVTQADLAPLEALLREKTGQHHECRLVPPCADPAEQLDFVSLLSEELEPGDRVVLDLTHGLRNQSLMLAQSALMLECAYGVRIKGLFYGGLEIPRKKEAPAPAVDLTGLLAQARIAQAIHAFRESGDVRLLLPHLPEGGFKRQVANLGHAVAIHSYAEARNLATNALGALSTTDIGVMAPLLRKALEAFKARSLAESQYQQAEAWLERKDYLRATLQLFEGAITRVCQRKGWDTTDPTERIKQSGAALRNLHDDDWKALEFLRNQMAHGIATDWHGLMKIAKNPEELDKLLRRLLITIPNLANKA